MEENTSKPKQTRRRSKEAKAVRRAEILALANMAFVEGGYSSIKMRDIAASLNTTAAALYTYYRTKGDILKAIVNEGLTKLQDEINKISPVQPFKEGIYEIIDVFFTFAGKYPHLYNLLYRKDNEIDFLDEETRLSYLILKFKLQEMLRANGVQNPHELWEIRDKLTNTLWSMIHGQIVLRHQILISTPSISDPDMMYPFEVVMDAWRREYSFFKK